jgi:hypothetical protein
MKRFAIAWLMGSTCAGLVGFGLHAPVWATWVIGFAVASVVHYAVPE